MCPQSLSYNTFLKTCTTPTRGIGASGADSSPRHDICHLGQVGLIGLPLVKLVVIEKCLIWHHMLQFLFLINNNI